MLLLLLLSSIASALAQPASPLQGQVTATGTAQPIDGVRVSLDLDPAAPPAEFETRSNPFGWYSFPPVPGGSYRLRFEHPAYLPFETNVVVAPGAVLVRNVSLAPVPGDPRFDIQFQVADVTTGLPLAGVPVRLRRYALANDTVPADDSTLSTDASGFGVFRGVARGDFSFEANVAGGLPHYEPYPATPRRRIEGNHLGSFRLKPIPGQLTVLVTGRDAITGNIGPLDDVFVEVTGLDPRDERAVVVPTMSGVTSDGGTAAFPGLPPVSYRITAKRLGYAPGEDIVQASRLDNPAPIVVPLSSRLKSLKVLLTSPYLQESILQGVPVVLQGLTNSNTQGYEKTLVTGEAPDRRDFFDILPGRYRLTADGSTTNALHGVRPAFRAEEYVDVYSDGEEIELPLEVLPAVLQGRLFAADTVGTAAGEGDPTGILGLRPIYQERQAAQIELIEYSDDALLRVTNRLISVDTDARGEFSVPVTPARYGIRILSLSNYWGSHVLHHQVTAPPDQPVPPGLPPATSDALLGQGWPFADPWPFAGRPPKNLTTSDGEPLLLNSGDHSLELYVHRQQANLVGTLGSGSLSSPTARVLLARQEDPYIELFADYSDLVHGGGVAKVRNTGTGESRTFPIEDDGANVTDMFVLRGLDAGDYELSFEHPRFDVRLGASTTLSFSVPAWRAPGVLPASDPASLGFIRALNPSPLPSFTIAVATPKPSTTVVRWEVLVWNEESENPEYELDEGAVPTIDFVQPDFAGGLVFDATRGFPIGGFTYWARVPGGALFEGRVNGEGANVLHTIFMGGPSASQESDGPSERGYSLTYRAVAADDRGTLIPGIQLALYGDDPEEAPLRLTTDTVDRTAVGTRFPPELIKEIVPGVIPEVVGDPSQRWDWQVRYETNRIGPIVVSIRTNGLFELTMVDPTIPRLALTVPMVLRNGIEYTGTLGTDTSTNSPAANKLQIRDRFGAVLAQTSADANGMVPIGPALGPLINRASTLYVDGCAPGFKPVRNRIAPTNQVQEISIELEPLTPPVIVGTEFDRFGLYMPGVRRFGNQGALQAFKEDGPLTLTWKVTAREQEVTTTTTTFDGPDGTPGTETTETAPDSISEVWFINALRFAQNPYDEPGIPIPPPADPSDSRAVRDWLDRIRYGSFGWVFRQVINSFTPGPGANEIVATGKADLWRMPPGEIRPVFVIVTRHGAITYQEGHEFPSASHVLTGVAQPRWLSFAQELMGFTAGVQATASMLSEIQPLGRFHALPRFTADLSVSDDGFLQYLYRLDVAWNEAMQTPDADFLMLAPPDLGLKVTGSMEFGLNIRTNGQLHLAASAGAGVDDIDLTELLPSRARRFLLGNGSLTGNFGGQGTTTRFAAVNPAGTDFEIGLEHELRGGFGFQAEVDLSPLTSLLPVIGPNLKLLSDFEILQTFATLRSQVELISVRSWQTTWPDHIAGGSGTDRDPRVLRRDSFGGNESEVMKDAGLCLCFNFGAGLRVAAFNDRLGASAEIALADALEGNPCEGFPSTCTEPSLLATLNPDGDWPLIKRIQGGVNLNLEAHVDAWITRLGWEYSLNLFPIDIPLGTDPRFDLIPYVSRVTVLTPLASGPAAFNPDPTHLVANLFPAGGSESASGPGGTGVLYTDVDPATGAMTLQFSARNAAGSWAAPMRVTSAPGIVSPALVALPSGTWLAAWSEIAAEDLASPVPGSTLRFSTSPDGTRWSAPGNVAVLPDTAFDLQLISFGDDGARLVFLRSSQGPLSNGNGLFGTSWTNENWSEAVELADNRPVEAFQATATRVGSTALQSVRAAGAPDPDRSLVIYREAGDARLGAVTWNETGARSQDTVTTNLAGPFAIATATATADSAVLVAAVVDPGVLRTFAPGDGDGGWEARGEVVPDTAPTFVDLAPWPAEAGNVPGPGWLLTWVSGGAEGRAWATRLAQQGVAAAEAPVRLTETADGTVRSLEWLDGGADRAFLLARMGGERDALRVLSFPPSPAGPAAPVLLEPAWLANGVFRFLLTGAPDRTFAIEVSTDFIRWEHLTDAIPQPPPGGTEIRDAWTPSAEPRFYRAVAR